MDLVAEPRRANTSSSVELYFQSTGDGISLLKSNHRTLNVTNGQLPLKRCLNPEIWIDDKKSDRVLTGSELDVLLDVVKRARASSSS